MRRFSGALFVNEISVESVVLVGERRLLSWSQLVGDAPGVGALPKSGATTEVSLDF